MTEAEFVHAAAEALRSAKSTGEAARKIHAICREAATAWGMKPDIECSLRSPVKSAHAGDGAHWHVSFEAGPYDWAVEVSSISSPKVWAEPYYGFDLSFYSKEARS